MFHVRLQFESCIEWVCFLLWIRNIYSIQCYIQTCFGTLWTVWAQKQKCFQHVSVVYFLQEPNEIVYKYFRNKYLFKIICFPKGIEYRLFPDSQLPPWEGFSCRKTMLTLNSRKQYTQETSGCGTACIFSMLFLLIFKSKTGLFVLLHGSPVFWFDRINSIVRILHLDQGIQEWTK